MEYVKNRSVIQQDVVQIREIFLGQELCFSLDVVGGFFPLADAVVAPRNL